MRGFVIVAGTLALAACNSGEQQNAADNTAAELEAIGNQADDNATAANNVQSVVLGLSEKALNGVLNRAIMDSEQACDGVIRSERRPDQEKSPAWTAFCRNGSSHIVIFTPDGLAKVLSPVQQR